MRYLIFTLPCLFACSPSDQVEQQGSISTEPAIGNVSTSVPSQGAKNDPNVIGEAIGQALADEIGASLQAAFEEQAAVYAQGGTPEAIAQARGHYDAAEVLSEEELSSAFTVQESAGDRSSLEVLESLVGSAGLALDATSFEAALSQVPRTQIEGLSTIEALERIAAEAGLVPVYPGVFAAGEDQHTIGFTDEPRTTPIAFAGPFLVLVSELEEQAPHAVGSVQLAAHAIGVPEAALMANDTMFETFSIEELESDQGIDLRSRPDVRRMSTPQFKGGLLTLSTEVELKGLLSGTKEIGTLSGMLHIKRPTQVTTVDFKSMAPGKQSIGDYEIELKEVGVNTSMKLQTQTSSEVTVVWAPDKSDGSPMGILNSNSYGYDKKIDASLITPEEPSRMSAKLIETEMLDIPFELEGIEFTRTSEQPKALTALKFDRALPVSVVFVEFKDRDSQFPEVLLRTVSHANKDARALHIKMIYLDDDNKEIKNSFTSMNAPPTFQSEAPLPFVQAGEIETTTQTAFFMPEETVSVQISVREVEFMDGTSWKADQ